MDIRTAIEICESALILGTFGVVAIVGYKLIAALDKYLKAPPNEVNVALSCDCGECHYGVENATVKEEN